LGEVYTPKSIHKKIQKLTGPTYYVYMSYNEIMDASKKGNLARFINHSCAPNSSAQRWDVNGEIRVGIIALKNIKSGDEITIDYQFDANPIEKKKCYCRGKRCRGFLGNRLIKLSEADFKPRITISNHVSHVEHLIEQEKKIRRY